MKKVLKVVALWSLLVGFVLGTVNIVKAEENFEGEVVTVGLVPGTAEDVWSVVSEQATTDGITIEIVLLNDYVQPNISLNDGSLDLNAFQHIAFLDNWNAENDADLQPIGYTFVSPMGAYSDKISSLDELQDGDIIAIPNDPTNGGRALLGLEIAGIIEVDDAAGALPTPSDITDNPLNLQFEETEAAQLPAVLPDVAAAFINNNFATDAGLSLETDAIFIDADHPEELNEAYRNVIAARPEDKDNPLYLKIAEYYNTPEVAKAIYEITGGDKPAWKDAPQSLEEAEAAIEAKE